MRIKFFENEFYIKIHAKNLSVFDYGASNMIYKISIFFLLLMVAILFALMNEKGGKIINARPIFEKEKIFGNVVDIKSDRDRIFITDYKQNQLFVFDHSLNHINTIGKPGPGPEEFSGILNFSIVDQTLIIFDDTQQQMKFFLTNGLFLKSIILSVRKLHSEFTADKNFNIYLSTPLSNKPITVIDSTGMLKKRFGEWVIPGNKFRNDGHLLYDNYGHIIFISFTEPLIHRYNKDGYRINNVDLKKYSLFKEKYNSYKRQYKDLEDNVILTFFLDAEIQDNLVYLLFKDIKNADFLAVFEYNEKDILFKRFIRIITNNTYLQKFCFLEPNIFISYDPLSGRMIKFEVETH